jgi:hypothetical protein
MARQVAKLAYRPAVADGLRRFEQALGSAVVPPQKAAKRPCKVASIFICQGMGIMLSVFFILSAAPSRQELHKRLETDGQMRPVSVVERLDAFKGDSLDLDVSGAANQ